MAREEVRSGLSREVVLSVALSAAYTASFTLGRFPGRWVVKAGSVALLAWFARRHPLLSAALFCGAVGDALLDLGPGSFVGGLAAFLVGHLVYAGLFIRAEGWPLSPVLAGALAIYAAAFAWWLWPSLGTLGVPVMLYIAAIAAMAALSIRGGLVVFSGALLFLISDSLLAVNRFKFELPDRDYLVWLTYYFGQFAIAWGWVNGSLPEPAHRSYKAGPRP